MQAVASTSDNQPDDASGSMRRAVLELADIPDTIARIAAEHAPKWTPQQRHFLAALLATTEFTIVLHANTAEQNCSCTGSLILFTRRVCYHAAALGFDGADAAAEDSGAAALIETLVKTLCAPAPEGHEAEVARVTASVWALLRGLGERADAELGRSTLAEAVESIGANLKLVRRQLLRLPVAYMHHCILPTMEICLLSHATLRLHVCRST